MHAVDAAPRISGLPERLAASVAGVAGLTLAAGLAAGGGLLAARRVAGAIRTPPSLAGLLAAAAAGLACLAVVDLARRLSPLPRGWLGSLFARGGLLAGLWGITAHGDDSRAVAVALVAAVAAVVPPLVKFAGVVRLRAPGRVVGRVGETPALMASPSPPARPVTATPHGEALCQRQERTLLEDGREQVRGTVVVGFRAGTKTAHAHVGFCPPLAELPEASVTTTYDEMDASVAIGERLPWGLRIECRLEEEADEAFEIPVDFTAIANLPTT